MWRLVTNFFFLGKFSINFEIHLLMFARYGVQLEKGPFERRTADFLWTMIFGAMSLLVLSAIPMLWAPFLGVSLVFMLLYVWSREYPNAQISIYGLVSLKEEKIGLVEYRTSMHQFLERHLYYFLTVLHPLARGRNILSTPTWPIGEWDIQQMLASNQKGELVWGTDVAFSGRSYRLNSRRKTNAGN